MAARNRRRKGFAAALRGETEAARPEVIGGRTLPTSKDVKKLTGVLNSFNKMLKKMSAKKPGRKAAAATPRPKRKGRKAKTVGCSVQGCKRPHCAKGLCSTHYSMEWKKHKLSAREDTVKPGKRGRKPKLLIVKTKPAAKRALKTCSVEGCNNPVLAKALCNKHYWAKMYIERKKAKK